MIESQYPYSWDGKIEKDIEAANNGVLPKGIPSNVDRSRIRYCIECSSEGHVGKYMGYDGLTIYHRPKWFRFLDDVEDSLKLGHGRFCNLELVFSLVKGNYIDAMERRAPGSAFAGRR